MAVIDEDQQKLLGSLMRFYPISMNTTSPVVLIKLSDKISNVITVKNFTDVIITIYIYIYHIGYISHSTTNNVGISIEIYINGPYLEI